MGKKRRQRDTNIDGSEDSTESGDGCNWKPPDCPHTAKAININKLRKVVKEKQLGEKCPDCQKNEDNANDNEDESLNEPPLLWICLQCGHVACGRNQKSHAIDHYNIPRSDSHCIVMDTQRWSTWCYTCDETVTKSNEGYRNKIHEVTELLKKWGKSNKPVQPKPSLPLCQNESPPIENEKKKSPANLPKVCGLVNLGNTCFFNAVMQCLAQTPYLVKVLDDLQVPEQKFRLPGGKLKISDDEEVELPPIEGVLETSSSFTPVLRKTLVDMQNSNGHTYRPSELLNALRKKTMQCTDGGQHDSHELLRHLLECVRNEDVRRYQAIILKEVGLSEKVKPQCVADNLKSKVKFYGNQANDKFLGPERVFRGQLISTLQCLECHHTSSRVEPFLDLSLPVLVDKSLPTVIKRKSTGFENSLDLIGNNGNNDGPSKYQLKKAQKSERAKARKNRKRNRDTILNTNCSPEEKKEGSEESDADVEDNIETEDASVPEVGESGYSSEKPSAVTSPVSSSDLKSQEDNSIDLNVSTDANETYDFTNLNYLPSTSDNRKDAEENVKNGTAGLSLSTSLVVHSDFTSPEGPTMSPLSSPLTSKDSPTSPISSAVDGDDVDKVDKLIPKEVDSTEKQDSSDKEDSKKANIEPVNDNKPNNENGTTKIVTNGVVEVISTVSKLELSSPSGSPNKYAVKEGELSVQLCLNQFTALELMNGNNKVGCTACTERKNEGKKEGTKMVCTDSTKQYLVSKVPAVLILHLKRFQVQKFSFRKFGKHVSFPMLLDLSPVSKDYTKQRIYALYGVVEHSGTMYGGHYVAYVKSRAPLKPNDPRWAFLPSKDGFENKDSPSGSNSELENDEVSHSNPPQIEPPPGQWYYVSDSRVHEVDEKEVLNSEAYLLFYERIL